MTKPNICICVPSGDEWKADMSMSYGALIARTATSIPLSGMYFINERNSVISRARNMLVRRAMMFDPVPTHILWWDSDVVVPSDALGRLLSHDKDIVGAFYQRRTPPFDCAGILAGPPETNGLAPSSLMPFGFVLTKTWIFDTMDAPWFFESYDDLVKCERNLDGAVGEDASFGRKAKAFGFDIWCDTNLPAEHICGGVPVPWTKPEFKKLPTKKAA